MVIVIEGCGWWLGGDLGSSGQIAVKETTILEEFWEGKGWSGSWLILGWLLQWAMVIILGHLVTAKERQQGGLEREPFHESDPMIAISSFGLCQPWVIISDGWSGLL